MLNKYILLNYQLAFFIISFFIVTFIIYRLFRPWSKSALPIDIEWLTPPNKQTQIDNNVSISYRQIGAGEDILFIHGIGANTFCWRLLFSYFDITKYRLTLFDLPGFGYSTKNKDLKYDLDEQCQHVLELTRKLNLKQPILIGSSMGGTIALMLALKYDTLFKQVIAIAPAAGIKLIPKLFRKIKSVSNHFNWCLNTKVMAVILKMIFTNKKLVTENTIHGYLNPYLKNKTESIRAFVNSAHLIMDHRLPHCFRNLKITPLILGSKKDSMVKKKHIQLLLNSIPNYQFELHKSAGHHLMEEDPEWVFKKIEIHLSI